MGWGTIVRKLLKKVAAATGSDVIQDVGNSLLYLVMLGLIFMGIGVGADKFKAVANVTDPTQLTLVGPIMGGLNQGMDMGSVAIVMGFVSIIIYALTGVWRQVRAEGLIR